ncbi:dickkopf-related protein 3-like [Sinocyclocheilus rhinocerous]|uniref:dickkopf-related protein 3-like n=1 Tax=Sinocyclocheilus rhinocerous TaxID=307959 RepID=UPI0007BA01DB|nr:PREDICTED: dickkopf-related protein 3-like [Sinocyclocheilus rhinocerous]
MLKFVILSLCVGFVVGSSVHRGGHLDITEALEEHVAQGQTTLNEMFREVEKLMEDTQQKLEEAVHQMENESSKSLLHGRNFPASFHNETMTVIKVGNRTVQLIERIDKETDNKIGKTHFSRTLIQNTERWNEVDHECMIDEDCGDGSFCLYEIITSKCVPCQTTNMVCAHFYLTTFPVVWSPSHPNLLPFCCTSFCSLCLSLLFLIFLCFFFSPALLFPVCRPKPQEGQGCHSHPNQLMDLLLWDEEGPREHCPCATGLHCQPLKNKSVCVDERNTSGEENAD